MRVCRIGTRSGSRVLGCPSGTATGPRRIVWVPQPACSARGTAVRAARPRAARSAGERCSTVLAFAISLLGAGTVTGAANECPSVDGRQIRRRRPGVTAAPITAAFAKGDGPGVTALVTTAAFATGARTTPTLPIRPGLSGMSGSCRLEGLVGLDGRDDGLDRDASVGDQLTAGAARGR